MNAWRVLVTGSRKWGEGADELASLQREVLTNYLHGLYAQAGEAHATITFVNGMCPTGADAQVARWVKDYADEDEATIEVHHANWEKWGKRAGPIRNAQMVKTMEAGNERHFVLAFLHDGGPNDNRGTRNTIETARKAGLRVIVFQVQAP